MLSGIGGHLPEIIIVLVVILIIWGPGKLPDVGAAMGKGIREFRKASSEAHDTVVGTTTTPGASRCPSRAGCGCRTCSRRSRPSLWPCRPTRRRTSLQFPANAPPARALTGGT